MQKRHARGNILRPVIAAHGHFKLLSQQFPEVKTHVIAHECFYAARRSLPGRRFSSAARRSMVCGRRDKEPSQPGSVAATGENPSWLVAKFMAALDAGRESENGLPACRHCRRERLSTRPCGQPTVYNMAGNRPAFAQSALYSAGRVTQIVASLVQEYNATLTAAAPGG